MSGGMGKASRPQKIGLRADLVQQHTRAAGTKGDVMRKPCLAEEWFVEDAVEKGMPEADARDCYNLSRAIRIEHILAGRLDLARKTSDFAYVETMETITSLVVLGAAVRETEE